jgi:hypothetical protein
MSDLRAAAQQALKALEQSRPLASEDDFVLLVRQHQQAITALRAALAQQEQETITVDELSAALGWPGGISTPVLDKKELLRMVANTRVTQQEPVASIYVTIGGEREFDDWRCPLPVGRNLLYTHPPRREWRSLSEEEIWTLAANSLDSVLGRLRFARAIEAALKEKNHE